MRRMLRKSRNPNSYGATRLTRRPHRMVKVDNVGVFVFQRRVPVRMAMRFRSLPALVLMSMVLFVDMQMFVLQRVVPVLQLARVVSRP